MVVAHALHPPEEPLDHLVVGVSFQAFLSYPKVERISQQPFVVGTNVHADRQGRGRMDTPGTCSGWNGSIFGGLVTSGSISR